jgi:hypothetical protein
MRVKSCLLVASVPVLGFATPAMAKPGDPIEMENGGTLDPMLDVRLRYETVDQPTFPDNAEALTLRGRFGVQYKLEGFSFLVEGEGTLALSDDYNDTLPGNGVEPYPVVADPENIELNRLQLSYMKDGTGVTVGRQRIILDNARFVGNVGWRQNEQTFDAVRGQAKIGSVTLDATYSIKQRTIFGVDSPNEHFDGDIVLLNGGAKAGPIDVKAFAYIVDYDTRVAFSSQTFGLLAKGSLPLGGGAKLDLLGSYATQSDMGGNPVSYSADYLNAEAGFSIAGFGLKAGYEVLGSDNGVAAFQTPLATLHAFNGWADMFLTTPPGGIQDFYITASKALTEVKAIPGLSVAVTYHSFDSDFGGVDYGSEWNALLGFKIGPVGLVAKYAKYNADLFGVDTEKFWLQAEISF